jgi:hypothetical protein
MHATTVVLPHGYWIGGVCHRDADLHPVTGNDEAFFVEAGDRLLPAEKATALLARCVARVGSLDHVTPDLARSLTMGDREALLLQLRRLALGDRLQAAVRCPDDDCRGQMDVPLNVTDLLLAPYKHSRERYDVTIPTDATTYRLRVRVPTGGDVEAAARIAVTNPQAAADGLARALVDSVVGDREERVEPLPAAVARALPDALSELDPQAEVRLTLACVECGRRIAALFDAASYVFHEIAGGMKQLYREVHLLAFHYHWSEAEIMGMTPGRRRRYVGLLVEALTR